MSGGSIFGKHFKVISFGESHGPAYGVVIEGMLAGVPFDETLLLSDLARRKPGQSQFVTQRQESDSPEILSGIFENKTLGTPIAVIVRNTNQKSSDYDQIKKQPRIGHADDVWLKKFGHVDHRGGGRSSGRETLNRVIAGSFAKMLMSSYYPNLKITARAIQIGDEKLNFNDLELPQSIQQMLSDARLQGESYGGVIECRVTSMIAGLGQPVFDKFKSDLSAAQLSLGATVGFEFGSGFSKVNLKGSEYHTALDSKNYGGIRGGLTTGEDLIFRVAFKPTSSIHDVAKTGRHDPCILPRAIPVVEAMTWLVIADHYLRSRTERL